ncbi:hypothetical protein BKI52_18295 [marine bacterium AO1-C]|nr:hypothetical protein BKI52_18295 [marine bacterium AO1-C]
MKTSKEDSEVELIKNIIGGETSSFRVLVERYKDIAFSLACSIIKNPAEAEDVLQDAFVKAFKNLHKFHFKASFSTWFYRIVINTCYSAIEKRKKQAVVPLDNLVVAHKSLDANTFDLLRDEERKVIINQILDQMKPKEALVLKLHYLGELKIPEIAKVTKMTQANIKVILHRARKNFQATLDQLLGTEKKHLL